MDKTRNAAGADPAPLPIELATPLHRTLARSLLAYAVGQALFCKHCGSVLDVESAQLLQLWTDKGAERLTVQMVPCGDCAPKVLQHIGGGLWLRGLLWQVVVEVDGKALADAC